MSDTQALKPFTLDEVTCYYIYKDIKRIFR